MISLISLGSLYLIQILSLFCFLLSYLQKKIALFTFFAIFLPVVCYYYYSGLIVSHDSINFYIPFYEGTSWRLFEPGYTFLNSVFNSLGFGAYQFICTILVVNLYLTFYSVKKVLNDSASMLLSAFFLFSQISFAFIYMGLFRQSIAMSMVFLSLYFFLSDKKKTALAIIILSCLIHYSFVIFFAVAFFLKISLENKKKLTFLFVFFAVLSPYFVGMLVSVLQGFSSGTLIDSFLRVVTYTEDNGLHEHYFFKYIFSCGIFIFHMTFLSKYYRGTKDYAILNVIYSYSMCSLLGASVTYFSNEASIRILYNFNLFLTLLYSSFFVRTKIKPKILVFIMMILILIVYGYFSFEWMSSFINRYIVIDE